MKIEKNMLYQIIIIGAIVISILSSLVIWQMFLIFPIFIFVGFILLVIVRKKGHLDDERTLKISEKASEKTIIVFIFGSIMLLFIFGFVLLFWARDPSFSVEPFQWILELASSMFQSAFIISVIYLFFYVYYRFIYGGF